MENIDINSLNEEQRNEIYKAYRKHLKSREWKEVQEIVKDRDKTCRFCGRTDDEMTLKNGKRLSWQYHHIPEGYLHIFDGPKEEAKYVTLVCSPCHRALHLAPSNRSRFTIKQTTKKK